MQALVYYAIFHNLSAQNYIEVVDVRANLFKDTNVFKAYRNWGTVSQYNSLTNKKHFSLSSRQTATIPLHYRKMCIVSKLYLLWDAIIDPLVLSSKEMQYCIRYSRGSRIAMRQSQTHPEAQRENFHDELSTWSKSAELSQIQWGTGCTRPLYRPS